MDLNLVETRSLVNELISRHEGIIIATLKTEEQGVPIVYTYWSDERYIECLGLCSAIEHDIKQYYANNEQIETEE